MFSGAMTQIVFFSLSKGSVLIQRGELVCGRMEKNAL